MKRTITQSEFCRAFNEMGRGNQYSWEARQALYDWLIEYEEATGEELELDPIAICCDFTEYENLAEFQNDYGTECESLDDVREETTVIELAGESFIIQLF